MLPTIKTSDSVLKEIELIVVNKGISYIDAVVYYCDQNNIETDMIGDMIRSSSSIKQRIQLEAEDLNFLPKTNRLPV
jgi:hypothetical protein